jgi:hypothetical protein
LGYPNSGASPSTCPRLRAGRAGCRGEHEGWMQTMRRDWAPGRKALSDRLALKPYWGKPAVRNFRGDDGNVGIIRSPVRAIVLLTHLKLD